jgi:hypothetical protein
VAGAARPQSTAVKNGGPTQRARGVYVQVQVVVAASDESDDRLVEEGEGGREHGEASQSRQPHWGLSVGVRTDSQAHR